MRSWSRNQKRPIRASNLRGWFVAGEAAHRRRANTHEASHGCAVPLKEGAGIPDAMTIRNGAGGAPARAERVERGSRAGSPRRRRDAKGVSCE